ncbi:MAG: energy-coupling factor ABC transporter ATP-binding protein [Candidatus Chromulinivorax sp.]|nr:energy-coupling factor ABC transporter ATP-binding protein [Candidatus Chromulinivorax sp.]
MNLKKQVTLRDVNFSFTHNGKPFFEDLSIDFNIGQINFVCGKNGMGKSTLLKILSGMALQKNVSGTLHVDGLTYDLQKIDGMLQSIAMVSQNFNSMLVDSYSFYENLQFALLPQYPFFQGLSVSLPLPEFVEKYGINELLPIHLLSGGQRQILSILMVVQRSPKILLLDEPTAALDEENAGIVMDFLQNLCIQENITIIMIVHNIDVVEKYTRSSYFELYLDAGIRRVREVVMV